MTRASSTILITGAAGNLGSLMARHLLHSDVNLRLMVHRRPLLPELQRADRVMQVRADLSNPATLPAVVDSVDVVIHFAGTSGSRPSVRSCPNTACRGAVAVPTNGGERYGTGCAEVRHGLRLGNQDDRRRAMACPPAPSRSLEQSDVDSSHIHG